MDTQQSDFSGIQLWHCRGARSLRALWALEEMGLDYRVEVMPFPPRMYQREFLDINPLGTVPFMKDGEVTMTESSGICQYLVDRYGKFDFGLRPDHPEYGDYLNWLHQSDATLTFPQTISVRYYLLEPKPEFQPVADSYLKWYIARLRRLDTHLESHEYLVDNRFTVADIAIAYALFLGKTLKFSKHYQPQTLNYLERMMERPAFQRANKIGATGKSNDGIL